MQKVSPSVPLHRGQLIGIIALSASCERALFERGVAFLESLGYRAKVALDPCRHYGDSTYLFSSDDARARARALEDLFIDKEVAAIIAARGAYGSMEVLPELDFSLIARHPKRIVGFSDTTAILTACYAKAGVPAVHGPSIGSAFGRAEESAQARQSAVCLIDFLTGNIKNPFKDLPLDLVAGKGTGQGPLLGGNLSMLCACIGTPYEADYKGHILFLEEVGERPYRVHRMLLQLKQSGRLQGLKGIVLGSFKNCDHPNQRGPSLNEVFRDIFADVDYPVVGMIPAGHAEWNLPLPFGSEAKIGSGQLEIRSE